jgi:ribosomal protein S21
MIKRFTRKVRDERVLEEYRERQYYRKPSEKRRQKKAKARYAIKNAIES